MQLCIVRWLSLELILIRCVLIGVQNCLVHCAGGSGRTGMVIAGIAKVCTS